MILSHSLQPRHEQAHSILSARPRCSGLFWLAFEGDAWLERPQRLPGSSVATHARRDEVALIMTLRHPSRASHIMPSRRREAYAARWHRRGVTSSVHYAVAHHRTSDADAIRVKRLNLLSTEGYHERPHTQTHAHKPSIDLNKPIVLVVIRGLSLPHTTMS